MTAAAVDALLGSAALVFGSLPPAGRDLDLLLPPAEAERLGAALAGAGWTRSRRSFARFADCTAFAVDVVPVDSWSPGPSVTARLFDESVPLPGFRSLRGLAPHHRLLVLARRFGEGLDLGPRAAELRAVDARTWAQARQEAPDWGLGPTLDRMRAALDADVPRPRRRGRRRRRPLVVALSGLDGAGKSTHAEHLRTALEQLGLPTTVSWSKVARDPVLDALAAPVKAVLARLPGTGPPPGPPPAADVDASGEVRNHPDGPRPPPDRGTLLRRRSAVLAWAWAGLVAVANGVTHRRLVGAADTAVVICDRYVLDSRAHLLHRYGEGRALRLPRLLVRWWSPRPACAVFLDVAPATARARKPEQYTTADLTALRGLYLREAGRLRVARVDVDRPVDEVAAEVARTVWLRLRAR